MEIHREGRKCGRSRLEAEGSVGNVCKSLYCGFGGKKGRGCVTRVRIGWFEAFQWAVECRSCPWSSGSSLRMIRTGR